MFFKILFNYILGYVNIKIEGFYIERFINICKSKGILLWNMKREKSSILYANIGINDFKILKNIAKTSSCNIKLTKKMGLPFIFNKYKKRKIFFILLIFVLIVLLISSNYIWNIEIIGDNRIDKNEIIEELKNNGLSIGVAKSKLDTKSVINDIRMKREDIAWIGIDIKGTNAIVEIVESEKKPDIVKTDEYCNIISEKSGIITRINVSNGTAKVKVGDIVKEGDILVEGKLEGKYTEPIYVHAAADIEIKTWYSIRKNFEYKQVIEQKTGNTETKYSIKINNLQINFYKVLSKFENYDTISENKKLSLFSNFYLPIEIIKQENYEKKYEAVQYSKDELKKKSINELEEELNKQINEEKNILNRYVNIKENNEFIDIELVYEVLESVGTKEKINI